MTKQDTRQIADGEITRGFQTAYHLFRCQTLPLQDLCSVYCECILRWNSRFDHPGFCGGVCCLRGVTQCCPKNQERRKKRLATAPACPSPTVENHQSIPPLLLTTHQSPLTIISIAFDSKVLERSTRVN